MALLSGIKLELLKVVFRKKLWIAAAISILIFSTLICVIYSKKIDESFVAAMNGKKISVCEFNFFLNSIKDTVKNEIYEKYPDSVNLSAGQVWRLQLNDIPADKKVKELTMDKILEYNVQLEMAEELGLITYKDEPFYGENMKNMRKNKTIYGPRVYPEGVVVNKFIESVSEKLIKELISQDEIEKQAVEYLNVNGEAYNFVKEIEIKKILFSYGIDNYEIRKALAQEVYEQIVNGMSFDTLALKYTETEVGNCREEIQSIKLNSKFYSDEEKSLKETVLRLKEGETSQIIDTGREFCIVKCEKIYKNASSLDNVKEEIYKKLKKEKYNSIVIQKKSKARIKINQKVYQKIRIE